MTTPRLFEFVHDFCDVFFGKFLDFGRLLFRERVKFSLLVRGRLLFLVRNELGQLAECERRR